MNNLHINDTMTEIDVFDDNELKTFNSKEDVSLKIKHHNPLSATVESTLGLTIKGSGKQVPDLKTLFCLGF